MKVRISYTTEVDDSFRREINRYYGKPGLANREEVKSWFLAYGESMNDELGLLAYDAAERGED